MKILKFFKQLFGSNKADNSRFHGEVVAVGDPDHKHAFAEVTWDPKYGKDFEPHAEDNRFATYRYLHACSCGAAYIERNIGNC